MRGKEDPNTVIGTDQRLFGQTFMALNGVDLTVYQGEALGIIGRNGAGKSTLLKLLSRITAPTEGEIKIRGRVASMLEVGTGFNNEMTGRENIYMNGAILGMTRAEIDAKLPQIIEFSECGDFIDTPVKRYSSGMFVKLAFAVAAHLDSEIMVMDEVLAVGDMKFQQKCLGKMSDVANQDGRTVLYVSHNMSTIRQLCTRCVVLDKGRVIFDGDVEQAIAVYMDTTDVNVVHYDLADVARMTGSAGKRFRLETLDFVGKESSVFADTEKMRGENHLARFGAVRGHPHEDEPPRAGFDARRHHPSRSTSAPPSRAKSTPLCLSLTRVCWARDNISSISTFLTARWPTRSAWISP